MRYTVTLTPDDNGTLLVSIPDLPEALTFGDSREEALLHAVDAIETALIAAMDAREEIPEPRASEPEWVALPALTVAKLALYRAMRADGVGKAALARRLGVSLPHIDRLLDLRHQSRLDAVERALAALDRIMTITIAAA